MNVGVLLCAELGLEPDVAGRMPVGVVADLCHRPAEAADAVRRLAVSRVVIGLCDSRPSAELLGALRGAGAEPFGIEPLRLAGHEREAAVLLAGAVAKLDQLAAGEYGRPILAGGDVSRRALFSRHAMLSQAPIAILDEAACIGSSRCGLCSTHCPVDAIDACNAMPTIDGNVCTACGACIGVCPVSALRLSGCSTGQLEAQLEQLFGHVEGVLFACRHADATAPPGWALVELPVLALLTPAWILQARARATLVGLAPCDRPSCAGAAEVVELAELIMAAAGESREPPAEALHLSEPRAEALHLSEPRAEALHLSEPRGTVDAVLALMPDGLPLTVRHVAAPVAILELEQNRCTLCGACATVCPTGALAFEEGDSTFLRHDPRICVGCDHCATVCPEHALAVSSGIDLPWLRAGAVGLMHADHERCMVCADQLPPLPMRRRVRALLPTMAGTPLDLCAACALKATVTRTATDDDARRGAPSATGSSQPDGP